MKIKKKKITKFKKGQKIKDCFGFFFGGVWGGGGGEGEGRFRYFQCTTRVMV